MDIEPLGNFPDFVPELAQLHFDEWRHLNPGTSLDQRIRRLQVMAQSADIPFVVVATESGELAGSAALVESDMPTRPDLSPWLASVCVKPHFRGRGVGTRLVRRIEDEAARRDLRKLYLFTEHARDLYAKLGWQDLETCQYQGAGVTIMFRELPG